MKYIVYLEWFCNDSNSYVAENLCACKDIETAKEFCLYANNADLVSYSGITEQVKGELRRILRENICVDLEFCYKEIPEL